MPDIWTWVGYAAAACTSLCALPQVLQAWRTQNVQGVSRRMYWLWLAGILLWLAYGWLTQEGPILVANGIALVLVLAMLLARYRFGSRWGGRRSSPADRKLLEHPDTRFTTRS